ncbi:MAG: 4-hydroxy-tetrahydrodipicolinate reductase [Chloroflexia bacterium]|nr:4-hydroxy-tetrahydrodipicolinate reductase [Chloroflexia bacterium]
MAGESPLRLVLIGIGGRMGQEIEALAEADRSVAVIGGIGRENAADLPALVQNCDVLIDFSTPESSAAAPSAAAGAGRPIVIGTTGLDADQMALLRDASERAPVWYARNMSTGVSLLQRVLPEIARALAGYDIEVIEAHHRHKVDAPSGTALMLADAILAGLSDAEAHPFVHGREGHAPRQPGEIGIHAIRGGGNSGEHAILFASDEEEIRISHRAYSRRAFAAGAIRAAKAIHGQPPGWYGAG